MQSPLQLTSARDPIDFRTFSPSFSVNSALGHIAGDKYLTPKEKNHMMSIVHGGAAQSANPWKGSLTTQDIVRGAIGAGIGSYAAKYIGTVVGGAFGGLSEKTLSRVQNTGALAGMLRGTGAWQ